MAGRRPATDRFGRRQSRMSMFQQSEKLCLSVADEEEVEPSPRGRRAPPALLGFSGVGPGNIKIPALTFEEELDLAASWELSSSGKLVSHRFGYEIGADGISRAPVPSSGEAGAAPVDARRRLDSGGSQPMSLDGGSRVNSDEDDDMDMDDSVIFDPSGRGAIPQTQPVAPSETMKASDVIELSMLGKGACGVVYLAFHMPTMSVIALKRVSVFDDEKRTLLLKELHTFESIGRGCENVVNYKGCFFDNGKLCIALQFANLGSLDDAVKRYGPCTDEEILARVAKQSVLALLHLQSKHEVHRDIKPANFLLSGRYCAPPSVLLADFGMLRDLKDTFDSCGTFVGTSAYMSPERVEGKKYSYASDVWAVGVTLIFCATGSNPFDPQGNGYFGLVAKIREMEVGLDPSKFSREACHFVGKCLDKDPKKRWSASQLVRHPFVNRAPAANVAAADTAGASQARTVFMQVTDFGVGEVKPNRKWQGRWGCGSDEVTETTVNDVEKVVRWMVPHFYSDEEYRGSLVDGARLNRVAEQFGVAPEVVVRVFEHVYAELKGGKK